MNTQALDMLISLATTPYTTQRALVKATGHSLGIVNRSLKELIAADYLDADIQLTSKAVAELQAKAPQQAVILAAGLGMRMIPINAETPKAFLEINNERLIERLIKQLHEIGIHAIYIVIGFMKEQFEYLIDEYGVELIVNQEYATKNNLHSLRLVSAHLSNAYIVPCDIWCAHNPFHRHELYSWYMISETLDDKSFVRINRKNELVAVPPSETGNAMVGICYLTDDQAQEVRERVERYDDNIRYKHSFWEETLFDKSRMIVHGKLLAKDDVVEIDTFEQLRDLDSGSNQLQSDAISVIADALHVKPNEINGIRTLKKGMTNRSFLFTCRGNKYIMRIPGEGTDKLINRKQEAAVYQAIAATQLCDDPIYINPENGYKLTRYIENVRCCDPGNADDLTLCMKKLRQFHQMELVVPHTFDIYRHIDFYESLWDGHSSIFKDYITTKANVLSLKSFIEKHRGKLQLTHIDAVPDNFLFDPSQQGTLALQLTDWEYAAMQDKHVDIAMFAIYSLYNKQQVDRLIDIYFAEDGGCDMVIRTKIYCYIAACGLLWSNWCEFKRHYGVEFGKYSLYQYRYAKEYYRYAEALLNELGESPVQKGGQSNV